MISLRFPPESGSGKSEVIWDAAAPFYEFERQRLDRRKSDTLPGGERRGENQPVKKSCVPAGQVVEAASHVFDPLYAKLLANERESQALAALRDTLLPKLLSGEIRVGTTNAELVA